MKNQAIGVVVEVDSTQMLNIFPILKGKFRIVEIEDKFGHYNITMYGATIVEDCGCEGIEISDTKLYWFYPEMIVEKD